MVSILPFAVVIHPFAAVGRGSAHIELRRRSKLTRSFGRI